MQGNSAALEERADPDDYFWKLYVDFIDDSHKREGCPIEQECNYSSTSPESPCNGCYVKCDIYRGTFDDGK